MDRFTFISSLVSSLGWPLAAAALALIFRRSLIARIPALTKVKAGSFEAEFAESAPILQATPDEGADAASPAADGGASVDEGSGTVGDVDRLNDVQRELVESAKRVVHEDPRLTVLQAWRAVETTVNRVFRDLDIPPTSATKGHGLPARRAAGVLDIRALQVSEVISPDDADRLFELRNLRNAAAHDTPKEITAATALDYVDAVERLLIALNAGAHRWEWRDEGEGDQDG